MSTDYTLILLYIVLKSQSSNSKPNVESSNLFISLLAESGCQTMTIFIFCPTPRNGIPTLLI